MLSASKSGSASGASGYSLTRSLRTRASATPWLNRTFASGGNQKTWTLSTWVKRGTLGSAQVLLSTGVLNTSDSTFANFGFNASDQLTFTAYSVAWRTTTQVFRDPSAWYHIVLAFDTTQATAANRVKLYVNGSQVTAFASSTDPTLNTDYAFNQAAAHYLGYPAYSYSYFDGYKAETYFINGQQLTPSSFGSTNALTGVWQPAQYTGTYGTNGFYLPFTDNSALTTSSNVGLGKDFSGNGNYWTTNNISITAGTTYDSMTDVPTLTSATAANFAVLNPLDNSGITIADGNLTCNQTGADSMLRGSFGVSSGKWYWEATLGNTKANVGIAKANAALSSYLGSDANGWGYYSVTGAKVNSGATSAYGATYTTSDVVGVAFDADAGTLTFYKNNVSQGVAFTGLTSGPYFPAQGTSTSLQYFNFGQRPFTYTPPSGYVALNTYNLPTSTIVKGNTVMDATIYSGDNASPRSITNAAGFKPDLVWVKSRSNLQSHKFTDSVRGAVNAFYTDSTSANDATPLYGSISAFNSNGFALSSGGSGISDVNGSGQNYVAWQWQAGQGATSSNTSGSITSTVSVNASAGFSIVSFTGNATLNATVGHGLGVAPTLVIYKNKISAQPWSVISESLLGLDGYLYLNTTAIKGTGASELRASTSSVLTLPGTYPDINPSGQAMLAYCFAPIAGYSAFGTFTGNGSADGNFLYLGFLPKFFLLKNLTGVESWLLWDTTRGTYNVVSPVLNPNSNAIESTLASFDFVSNGIKLRASTVQTYMYWAFASNPFKNSLAF